MGEIIEINNCGEIEETNGTTDIVEVAEQLLLDARNSSTTENCISVPVAQLGTLGAGVASLIPSLNTVTQTMTVNTSGLYQLANQVAGDTLKVAKNGNFWGSFKTVEGGSKFVQLQAAGPLSATSKAVMPINPATMMMAVALYSVEQKLGKIEEMEKQILSFLEIEKEAKIEADIRTLTGLITKFKANWDNEYFLSGNHQLVLSIQRDARANMISYQKEVSAIITEKKLIVAQNKVNAMLSNLTKKFTYYRLSLYILAMASFSEIMLSGNFKEDNITAIKDEIEKYALEYRDLFTECSLYLEKLSKSSINTNIMKGLGTAEAALGKFIGSIPKIKDGQVDEKLQDSGKQLKEGAEEISQDTIHALAQLGNPGTSIFTERMADMIQIYNHTTRICFDKDNIYLFAV